MAVKKKVTVPTHRATLATGETVDFHGAHPTAWTFGGADEKGEKDGSRVRSVPVVSIHPLSVFDDAAGNADDDEDYDDE